MTKTEQKKYMQEKWADLNALHDALYNQLERAKEYNDFDLAKDLTKTQEELWSIQTKIETEYATLKLGKYSIADIRENKYLDKKHYDFHWTDVKKELMSFKYESQLPQKTK